MGTCTGMLLLYSLLSVSCFYCATSFAWIEQRDGGSSELLRLHSNEFSQAEKNLTELLQLLQPEELDRIASVQYSLGELYGRAIKPGHALEAEHWLLQCTTTDLTKLDCWMSLAALYFKTNQFGKLKAVHLEIMKSPPGSLMDTQRDYQWRCLAPALLVSQMSALYYSAQGGHVGQAEWTYLALLGGALVLTEHHCEQLNPTFKLPVETELALSSAFQSAPNKNHFQSTVQSLCADPDLTQLLVQKKIRLHPCRQMDTAIMQSEDCPSQFGTDQENIEFMGAANLYDIVHHAYRSNSDSLFKNNFDTYKSELAILFAAHFNPKGIISLLDQLIDINSKLQGDPEKFKGRVIVYALIASQEHFNSLEFLSSTCFLGRQEALEIVSVQINCVGDIELLSREQFDYIEYNSGISVNKDYLQELHSFVAMLKPGGVIGMTGFADNPTVTAVREILRSSNVGSYNMRYNFVKEYLSSIGFSDLATYDTELVQYIANYGKKWQLDWTQHRINILLDIVQLKPISVFLPIIQHRPFETLASEPSVIRYKQLGLMETDYIAQYMQIFRHTVYASTGYRSSLSDSTSQYTVVNITDNTMIIDRSGNLLMRRATEAIRMKLSKYPLVFQWKRGLSMCPISVSIDSALLNAFAELHNYLSLKSMIDAVCRSKSNDHNCEEKARFGLISSINFLGSIGMISCWN